MHDTGAEQIQQQARYSRTTREEQTTHSTKVTSHNDPTNTGIKYNSKRAGLEHKTGVRYQCNKIEMEAKLDTDSERRQLQNKTGKRA